MLELRRMSPSWIMDLITSCDEQENLNPFWKWWFGDIESQVEASSFCQWTTDLDMDQYRSGVNFGLSVGERLSGCSWGSAELCV